MKALIRFSYAATIATYVLIFTGGLVRVSGAGLGCPDWPKCFGRWLPPTSVDQLPAHIDPSLFNVTLAWIEYGNRMLGMVVGLLILITAILALVHVRHLRRIWMPAVASALLVAYTGWQGGQVVAAELKPLLVAAHLLLSFLIASLLTWQTQQLHYLTHPDTEQSSRYPKGVARFLTFAWALAILQSTLGTQLRAAVKTIQDAMPLGGHSMWLDAVGPIKHAHLMLGIILVAFTIVLSGKLLRSAERPSPLVQQSSVALLLLSVVMLLIGGMMAFASYLPIFQLIHLWGAALTMGLLLLLIGALRRQEGGSNVQR